MPPALAVLVCVNSRNQVNWSYAGLVYRRCTVSGCGFSSVCHSLLIVCAAMQSLVLK